MRRYILIAAGLLAFFLTVYFAVEALKIPLLADPMPWMQQGGVLAATLGVSLLVADVLLPVPSSLVMVAHGALFGVITGTLLSLLGSMGAALLGFAIGRRGATSLERILRPAERARASEMLTRWGPLAVVVTRPIPLLAETVAIMAGTSTLGWGQMALAALVGSLPPAVLYALTGAAVASLQSTALMFVLVLLVTASFWIVGRLVEPYLNAKKKLRDENPGTSNDAVEF